MFLDASLGSLQPDCFLYFLFMRLLLKHVCAVFLRNLTVRCDKMWFLFLLKVRKASLTHTHSQG